MLSTRERIFTSVFVLFFVTLGARILVTSAVEKTDGLTRLSPPMVLTPGSFLGSEAPGELAMDGDIHTAWIESIPPRLYTREIPRRNHPAIPVSGTLYWIGELGFTHFPADPPLQNAPKEFYIWSGNQASEKDYYDYARPRRVRLVLLRQQMVDVDREFKLTRLPEVWGETSLELPDHPGRISIPLHFLSPLEDSTGFPRNVSRIWVRLEIQSYYPGKLHPDSIAVSELDYRSEISDHKSVLPEPPEMPGR